MNGEIQLHDVVALANDLPERGLVKGQVGAVVALLAPDAYEVEFSDEEGRTYAMFALAGKQLIVLHFHPVMAA